MSATDRRLLDHDPLTGITEWFHYDPHTEGFTIEYQQDVTPFIELAKYAYNNAPLRWGEFDHVKSIPKIFALDLQRRGIISGAFKILDDKKFREWLNERDTNWLRTRPGRI